MYIKFTISIFLLLPLSILAQRSETDSLIELEELVVTGYLSDQPLLQTPVSVGIVSSAKLAIHADGTFLPALNALPGIRMEERSPGSYRLSLRGSLLRSPWGVRNVKVYMDEFPLTDAGGNTYLNVIDIRSINRLEVLKGPDGSLFGANSGGVVVLDPFQKQRISSVKAGVSGGSYGFLHQNAGVLHSTNSSQFQVDQAFVRTDGYREQSSMERHYIQASERWNYNSTNQLKLFGFYADQFYQTPGGLNEAQYVEDPRQARQAAGPNPGAVEQNASISNRTLFGGISHEASFGDRLRHVASVFGSNTDFENPFITNFEERKEINYGLRTYLELSSRNSGKTAVDWKWNLGLEWQRSDHEIVNFDNIGNATKGNLQAADEILTDNHFYFTSLNAGLSEKLTAEVAVSLNYYNYKFQDLSSGTSGSRKFSPSWMPRISLSYLLTPKIAWRASVSRGYSTPTTAEIRPSDMVINTDLEAETGWNYETGVRLTGGNNRFQWDASVFLYRMEEAIVRRLDEGGNEFFANAGGTDQTGLESLMSYWLVAPQEAGFIRGFQLTNSYTLSYFKFRDYMQGTDDYSGNCLTGVPKNVVVSKVHLNLPASLYIAAQHNFTGRIPLNDANSVYADDYHLVQAKLGWSKSLKARGELQLFAGVDNLFNEKYSLGNDINAFGGRYYNVAAGRNFHVGLNVRL